MRAMLTAHLEDVAERDEPVAALWAAESSIYGRFGYGCAAETIELEIPRTHIDQHRLAPAAHPVRIIDKDQARTVLPPLYERLWKRYPGAFARSEKWWENRWFEGPKPTGEETSTRYAISIGEDGSPSGYIQYRQTPKWEHGIAAGEIIVLDLVGDDPGAWAGLWNFVLGHDLVATIKADLRPLDDPLIDLLAGNRRARRMVSDSLWVRLVDPVRALAARRYSAAGNLVLEVKDSMTSATTVLSLEVDAEGKAVCGPSSRPSDIILDLEDLGACYLGRARFRALARAGRLHGPAQALADADAMFTWDPQPWCPEIF
jgi:predicted acetyltransferase